MEVIHPRLREVYCRVKSPGILALAPLLPFLDPGGRQCRLPSAAPGDVNCAYTRPWQSAALSDRLLSHWPKPPLAADREETLRLKHSCGGEQNFIYALAGATTLPWEHPGDPAQTDASVHKHEVKSSSLGGGSCLDELMFAAL